MIKVEDGNVEIQGNRDEIMVDFMDIAQTVYNEVLDCRNDKDDEKLFNESLRFIKMTEEEQDQELLKMKNKTKLAEEVLNYLQSLEKGEDEEC